MSDRHQHEADRIARYLLGRPAGERERGIYADAMRRLALPLSPAEQTLWNSMLASPCRMACVDAGLALLRPDHVLRRKLYIMLAVLEASPGYTEFFLPRRFFPLYLLKVIAVGLRSALRAIAGVMVVKAAKI